MEELWVEKYRPKLISECILPKRIKDIFTGYVKSGEIPNIMLSGSPGTGKTSLAKALIRELKAEMLFVDASSDNGKAMLETMVVPFASTISMVNSDVPKCVLLDECLEENETIRIGTILEYKNVSLKELELNKEYPIVSMNMDTGLLENDTGYLCIDKEDKLYTVVFSHGLRIKCNGKHPFVLYNMSTKQYYKKRLEDNIINEICVLDNGVHVKIDDVIDLHCIGKVRDVHVYKNHTFITTNGLVTSNCDGLLATAQRAFRPVIEMYAKTTRFILTCNFPERIISPIKSRCSQFDFNIKKSDKAELMKLFYDRCVIILNDNNIPFDKKILGIFISKLFPDYRKIINELQSYATGYDKIDEGIITIGLENDIADKLYPMIKEHQFNDCRKWLADNLHSSDDVFASLYSRLNEFVPIEKQPEIILILAQYQSFNVVNQHINLLACFTEMMSVI